jgi:hypothetical protein
MTWQHVFNRRLIAWLFVSVCLLVGLCLPSHAAVVFDGTDDYAVTGGAPTLSGAAGLTVALWFKVPSTPLGGGALLAMGTYGSAWQYTFVLRLNSATQIRWGLSDGTNNTVWNATVGTLPNNTWTHIAATWDGTTMRLYINGIQEDSSSTNVWPSLNTAALLVYLGAEGRLADFFAGTIQEAQYWPVALSVNEIESLAKSRLFSVGIRSPLAYWPLDVCTDGASVNGVVFADGSGNGFPITGDDGANNTGLTCQTSTTLSYPWGAQ